MALSKYLVRLVLFFSFFSALSFSGCGLEVLFLGIPSGGSHSPPEVKPTTRLKGTVVGLSLAEISIRAGTSQIARGTTDASGAFDIELPQATFTNLVVSVSLNSTLLKTIVPLVEQSKTTDPGPIDTKSTAVAMILEAALSARGLDLINYPHEASKLAIDKLLLNIDNTDAFSKFRKIVEAIHTHAQSLSGSTPLLQTPRYKAAANANDAPTADQSGLNLEALGAGVDYCDKDAFDGCVDGAETSTQGFDIALGNAVKAFAFPSCQTSSSIRLIFTVSFDANAKDGNCNTIRQFKHAKRYGGLTCEQCKVYFAGGVHKDSSITDPKIANLFGNWEPNKTQMYDDGTHGDLVAGDGTWTVTFEVPAPQSTGQACKQNAECPDLGACVGGTCHKVLRVGYKYTFGLHGDIWGGTEEFPGNQRLLEVVDHNGDGFVARHDNFADETANKDRVNTLQKKGATGMTCFAVPSADQCNPETPTTNHPDCGCKADQDGDSVPDVRERSWDKDQDCTPDGFRVFANAQPLIVPGSCKY